MKLTVKFEVTPNDVEFVIGEILLINHLLTTNDFPTLKEDYVKLRISKKNVIFYLKKLYHYNNGCSWTSSLGGDDEYKSLLKEIEEKSKELSRKLFPDIYIKS